MVGKRKEMRVGMRLLLVSGFLAIALLIGLICYLAVALSGMLVPAAEMRGAGLLAALGIAALAVLAGLSLSNLISKPLKELASAIREIMRGKLDRKLEGSRVREVQELTDSLNSILASLKLAILKTGLSKTDIGLGEAITAKEEAERELKKSEFELRESQRIAMLGRWHLDLATNKLAWSPGIYELFGLDPETFEASYEAFLAAVHPEDREFVDKTYRNSVKNRKPYDIVHRIVRPGGEVRWVREICETAYNRKGKPVSSTGTVQEVTKLKEAEEQLRVYLKGFDNSPDSMMVAEYKDKKPRILRINKAFTEYYGYTQEEVVGKNPRFLKTEKEDKNYYRKMWAAMLDPRIGFWRDEVVNRRKDGSLIDVILTVTGIFDEKGRPRYFVANHVDITQLKRAAEEIASLAKFPSENPYPVLRVGRDGRLVFANDASKNLLEQWDCAVGKSVPESIHKQIRNAVRSGNIVNTNLSIRGRSVHLSMVPVKGADYVNMYGLDIIWHSAAGRKTSGKQAQRYKGK